MNEAHIIQIPESGVFLAHGHDKESHRFITTLLHAAQDGRITILEGQAVFPLEYLSHFMDMAEETGIDVVEGEEEE